MLLPERMRPARVSTKKINELAKMVEQILSEIDKGADQDNTELKKKMADWNCQVITPCEFSDFRDYSAHTNARDFVRAALNYAKYYADFTWSELVQTINYVCNGNASESEQHHALLLLENNFNGNVSDLIYWPDVWFQIADMPDVEFTSEELAAYLMTRSGRVLADAPDIELRYPIPDC
ncbi:hypothetical protein [Pantoea sp. Lij88]|uniref:hypothetical protein n=1 Tax=Pantoea sp. Lij88 TaxID=3028622 RepID=UPI0024B9E4F0|nr:hypothetical protein [Pantoea sp. Lij88]WHQ73729.1 hypothetical protein PU624_03450 [Pantoea sp. Lij88]